MCETFYVFQLEFNNCIVGNISRIDLLQNYYQVFMSGHTITHISSLANDIKIVSTYLLFQLDYKREK
jgi:hypothetical protein